MRPILAGRRTGESSIFRVHEWAMQRTETDGVMSVRQFTKKNYDAIVFNFR